MERLTLKSDYSLKYKLQSLSVEESTIEYRNRVDNANWNSVVFQTKYRERERVKIDYHRIYCSFNVHGMEILMSDFKNNDVKVKWIMLYVCCFMLQKLILKISQSFANLCIR